MYFDCSLKIEGAGAGVLLISPTGEQLKYVLQIFWKVSNNEAEYEALLPGLRLTASLGIKRLSYGPPWAHYLGGYQDRLLGGPLGLPGLRYTAPEGVEHKDSIGVVLG
jgi:hypothetical protein